MYWLNFSTEKNEPSEASFNSENKKEDNKMKESIKNKNASLTATNNTEKTNERRKTISEYNENLLQKLKKSTDIEILTFQLQEQSDNNHYLSEQLKITERSLSDTLRYFGSEHTSSSMFFGHNEDKNVANLSNSVLTLSSAHQEQVLNQRTRNEELTDLLRGKNDALHLMMRDLLEKEEMILELEKSVKDLQRKNSTLIQSSRRKDIESNDLLRRLLAADPSATLTSNQGLIEKEEDLLDYSVYHDDTISINSDDDDDKNSKNLKKGFINPMRGSMLRASIAGAENSPFVEKSVFSLNSEKEEVLKENNPLMFPPGRKALVEYTVYPSFSENEGFNPMRSEKKSIKIPIDDDENINRLESFSLPVNLTPLSKLGFSTADDENPEEINTIDPETIFSDVNPLFARKSEKNVKKEILKNLFENQETQTNFDNYIDNQENFQKIKAENKMLNKLISQDTQTDIQIPNPKLVNEQETQTFDLEPIFNSIENTQTQINPKNSVLIPLSDVETQTDVEAPNLNEEKPQREMQDPILKSSKEFETQTPIPNSLTDGETQTVNLELRIESIETQTEFQNPFSKPSSDSETQTVNPKPIIESNETQTDFTNIIPNPSYETETKTEFQTDIISKETENQETQTSEGKINPVDSKTNSTQTDNQEKTVTSSKSVLRLSAVSEDTTDMSSLDSNMERSNRAEIKSDRNIKNIISTKKDNIVSRFLVQCKTKKAVMGGSYQKTLLLIKTDNIIELMKIPGSELKGQNKSSNVEEESQETLKKLGYSTINTLSLNSIEMLELEPNNNSIHIHSSDKNSKKLRVLVETTDEALNLVQFLFRRSVAIKA